jgi:1-aminocyclopropane-1-carboxylate deaminase
MLPLLVPSAITVDDITSFFKRKAEVHVLRLDKISPVISGNKWFKLRYYIEEAKAMRKKGILTFGGAWSNHIIATAGACGAAGLKSIGIIRGEKPGSLSPTLMQAEQYGMQLTFIPRLDYKMKIIPNEMNSGDFLIVNEGGHGTTGSKGASTMLDYCGDFYTHYACAVGTGTMLSGIINRITDLQHAIGVSVFKQNTSLETGVQQLVPGKTKTNWQIIHDYSFGGYAKYQPPLLDFMNDFYRYTYIPSDFVYTAKLFFAVSDLIEKNYFPEKSKILIIHSGGLQGNKSLPSGTLMF